MGTQYVTPAQLRAYVNQFAIQDIPDDDLNTACIAASDLCDDYFRPRYALPFQGDTPPSVQLHAAWIAAFIALQTRGYNPAREGDPDPIRDNYNLAMNWLADVQHQRIMLNVTQAATSPPNYQLPSVSSSRPRGW